MIVADTNLLAYLHLPGERTAKAERVLLQDDDWHAPPLWRSEFQNVLVLQFRRGLISFDTALEAFREADLMMREHEHSAETRRVLELARDSNCSAYDCEFVALAEALGVPLVTSDGRILKSFPDIAVSSEDFTGPNSFGDASDGSE